MTVVDGPSPRADPGIASADTGRVEAFSDGVFAIAVTLLVLDLKVGEHVPAGGLAHALGRMWPQFATYVVSFATIGIIWINHHALLRRIAVADRGLLLLNLLLLLFVSVIPFPTQLLARFLRAGDDQHVAAAVYVGTLLLMGFVFFSIWSYARHRRLVHGALTPRTVRFVTRRNFAGQMAYVVALGVAFVSAPAALAIAGGVAIYFLLPERLLGAPAE